MKSCYHDVAGVFFLCIKLMLKKAFLCYTYMKHTQQYREAVATFKYDIEYNLKTKHIMHTYLKLHTFLKNSVFKHLISEFSDTISQSEVCFWKSQQNIYFLNLFIHAQKSYCASISKFSHLMNNRSLIKIKIKIAS